MFAGFTNVLKGIGGEYEINRVVGALGTLFYTICANAFVAVNVLMYDREFNVTEYCLAFPGGLAVCVGAIAAGTAYKDKGVATAQVIRDTGAVPTPPPAGPPVPTEPAQ